MVSDNVDMSKLVGLYAMTAQMRILSAPAVAVNAERVIHLIVAMNFAPNLTLHDLHEKAGSEPGEMLDPLRRFSEACRADLIAREVV